MKSLYFLTLSIVLSLPLSAQTYVEVACGEGYSQQAYYRLSDDQSVKLENDSWDVAFTAVGFQDAGIFINESSSSSFTDPQPELELYLAPTQNFEDPIDPSELYERRYNEEKNWHHGAFNVDRDLFNPLDFGWGIYSPATNRVIGQLVYVLKLRNGQYKKFSVDSLVITTYYVRWADLDGSNLQSMAINKQAHQSAGFAYLSIQQGVLVNNAPSDWDFFWGRYTTPLDDGQGGILEYNVTGVLHGPGISVAQADSVDVQAVDFYGGGYDQQLSAEPTIIGSDWKVFDFAEGWLIVPDRAYFVKTSENRIWKVVFIDFEGISTGNMVFEKADLGLLSFLDDHQKSAPTPGIGPNPAPAGSALFLDWPGEAGSATLWLHDLTGRPLWQQPLNVQAGFQVAGNFPVSIPSGTYVLTIQQGDQKWSRTWMITN